MIHPFFSTLVTQPGLIVEHLDAYADLAKAEAGDWASAIQSRWLLKASIGVCVMLTVLLVGIAALLAGVTDWHAMPHPWVLLVVPATPALVALACWWRLKGVEASQPFNLLRDQVALDLRLMRSANARAGGDD